MTGAEIVVAGKAVEAIGAKALGQDEQTRTELLVAARETPQFKAAARTSAARTAVKERIKLKLYQPFARMLGVSKAYFEDDFPDEMAAKTAHIPDEHMITPPASIAVPAMQGLAYSFEEPNLKEMYLNLLTAAADDRRTDDTHPAFVDVIKQLSARETGFLNVALAMGRIPVAQLRDHVSSTGFKIRVTHLANFVNKSGEAVEVPQAPMWIDNWARLGLFEVSYERYIVGDEAYVWVDARPEYVRIAQEEDISRLDIHKGVIARTAFGERFLQAVAPPPRDAN